MKNLKRVILYDALMFALLLTSPDMVRAQNVAEHSSALNTENVIEKDTRAEKLRVYLAEHNSPAVDSAETFVAKADEYNLPWNLVVAIFGVESTFGKHVPAGSYNGWGWGIPTGARSGIGFDSWDDGIDMVSKGLSEKYVKRGLDTPEKMGRVYAPPSNTWAGNVKFFMKQVEEVSLKPDLSI